MIQSIFLIEWDKFKLKDKETVNNLNHPYDNSLNTNGDLNNGELSIDDIEIENQRIRYFYPEINVSLNNSVAINKIINSQIIEIENFYRTNADASKEKETNNLKKKNSHGKKKNPVKGNRKGKSNSITKKSSHIEENISKNKSKVKATTSDKPIIEKITGVPPQNKINLNLFEPMSFNNNVNEKQESLELEQEGKQKQKQKQEGNQKIIEISSPSSQKQIIKTRKNMDVQLLFDFAIYSCYIPSNKIICLVFEKEDNPYDYTAEFEEILETMIFNDLNNFNKCSDLEMEIVLQSIFMDIRSKFLIVMDECAFYLNQQQLRERIIHYNQNKIIKLFVFGIDNAGKSSFMRFLKTGKFDHNFFAPTKQFVIHKVSMSNEIKLVAWEMPGQKSFRRVWLRGVQDSNLLVFILDAADKKRYVEAKRALWSIITRYEVKNVPLLFIANKIDLIEDESKLGTIESYFSLPELKDKTWTTKFMSLVTKQGVKDVIDWISDTLNQQFMEEFKSSIK